MFMDGCGDFLENRTRLSSIIECLVQRVREQSFPDSNVVSRESPWFVSSPIVLECQQAPICGRGRTLRDRKQEDGNGLIPIFGHVHPFLCVVSPHNTPHVRHPSLHLLQVVLENLGSSHERDDRRDLASHQQLSREPAPLLESIFVTWWASRETRNEDGVMFLEVAHHRNTDTLEQLEREYVTSDAP